MCSGALSPCPLVLDALCLLAPLLGSGAMGAGNRAAVCLWSLHGCSPEEGQAGGCRPCSALAPLLGTPLLHAWALGSPVTGTRCVIGYTHHRLSDSYRQLSSLFFKVFVFP